MLGIEGALLGALGAIAGIVTGLLMSYVLIHVINRQSFHWSMEMHWPVTELAAVSMALVASCAVTAVVSTRHALGTDAVRAVREDW
jgi:putative ABC transport system permease protein